MNKFILPLIIFAHIFILSNLVFFPYPELFVYPYLTNHGLKPYSQILDQHFPGLLFLPINFDNLGMNDEISARIWLFGIVILTHLLLFLVSSQILKSRSKALLVNLVYLLWQPFFEGWVLWIDNFLPLFLLPAFYFTLKKKLFVSGLFLGLGIVFKQTIIPLAMLILFYIYWENRNLKNALIYLSGLIFSLVLMLVYLLNLGVLKDFWYWTVIFNLTTYAKYGTQIPTSFGFILRVLVVFSGSLAVLFHKDGNLKHILFLFLIGSLAGAFDRANFVHFQPSLPFVVLATALGFYSLKKQTIFYVFVGAYILIMLWWQNIFYKGHLSDKVFFFDRETYDISNKIRQYTKVNDKIFVYGGAPHLYQMSQTLPAGNIFVFQFPWFLKVAEDRILEGIKKDKVEIVVSDRTVKIEDEPIVDFASKISSYLMENYQKIDQVGSVEILKRKIYDDK